MGKNKESNGKSVGAKSLSIHPPLIFKVVGQ
jgi:hypothetical protein